MLSFISREAFLDCLQEYPEIYIDLVSTLVSRLREAVAIASFFPGERDPLREIAIDLVLPSSHGVLAAQKSPGPCRGF